MQGKQPGETQPNNVIAFNRRTTSAWRWVWNFIGQPDEFFRSLLNQPRIYPALVLQAAVALAMPNFLLGAPNAAVSIQDQAFWYTVVALGSFAILNIWNLIYSACAFFLCTRGFKTVGSFKHVFIACAFTQAPYLLLGSGRLWSSLVAFIWSFLLSITAVQIAMKLAWWKSALTQVALFLASVAIACVIGSQIYSTYKSQLRHSRPHHPLTGIAAPNITIHPLDGPPLTLSSLKGKVVVLDFWATWCPPCRVGLPVVSQIVSQHKGVEFFAIDSSEEKAAITDYLGKQGLKITAATDPNAMDAMIMMARSIPQTMIVDRNGMVTAVHVGFSPDDAPEIAHEIEAALSSPAPASPGAGLHQ